MVLKRIDELGIVIPPSPEPAANYVSCSATGDIIYVSGQLPIKDGKVIYKGKLGDNIDIESGISSASLCALNIIAALNSALEGELDRITRCIKLTGYVNATPDFTNHPTIINGASNFMVDVFQDIGYHARAAVGVSSLPFNAATEIEAIFSFKR